MISVSNVGRARRRPRASLFLPALFVFALHAAGLMAAQTEPTHTDTEGDTYTVKLAGPGTMTVTYVDTGGGHGPIDTITLAGTTERSILSITTSAGGHTSFRSVTGPGALSALRAASVDVVGAGVSMAGGLGQIIVADIAANADFFLPPNRKLPRIVFTAGKIANDVSINAPAQTLTLRAIDIGVVTLRAKNAALIQATAGGFQGYIFIDGTLVALSVKGGNLDTVISALAIGTIRVAKAQATSPDGGSIFNSTISAAKTITAISIDGDLINSTILAGAKLGANALVGGSGEEADFFDRGSIGSVRIGGLVSDSILGAGFAPFDGVFGNGNDGVYGGAASKIGRLTVFGSVSADSRIGAGTFGPVNFGGAVIPPRADLQGRFVLTRLTSSIVPPSPSTTAKPLDLTEPSSFTDANSFLYTGPNAVQTNVKAGMIKPVSAAVVRGQVNTRHDTPLAGAEITVAGHPEFGVTHSQADGAFDMAVNGGGTFDFQFEATGFVGVKRRLNVAPQQFTALDPVALTTADPLVTPVGFGAAATEIQVHEASMQEDDSGPRHGLLMFSPGTTAMMRADDGSQTPAPMLHIRATEFTSGADGVTAMPATLPPNSAFTYCIDLTADEATQTGAHRIEFSKPVWFYLENFLHFPVGGDVPSGFYNRDLRQWEAGPNGRIIAIVSITGDAADLDVDGDGNADTGGALSSLGITLAEQQELATRYTPGQSLWRVPIAHFSPWDFNWPFGPPANATGPNGGPPGKPDRGNLDNPIDPVGVDIESQVVRDEFSLAGTPFSLNYRSSRTAGWKIANQIYIPLSGPDVPDSLKRIELQIVVGGKTTKQTFPPDPDLATTFEWDQLDAYGRKLLGQQNATITVSFIYDGDYAKPTRFASDGTGDTITGDKTRQEITISATYQRTLGNLDLTGLGIGGWTLDAHHVYDPLGRVLYLGDGTKRSVQSLPRIVETVAGTGVAGFSGDGGSAIAAQFNGVSGVTVGPDGSIYVSDSGNNRIRKIAPTGLVSTVAGNGTQGSTGDGGPATSAQIFAARVRYAVDGSLILSNGYASIRRIDPLGIITTLAGNGFSVIAGDGGPAVDALVGRRSCAAPGIDGTITLCDDGGQVRAIKPDGIIVHVAGGGASVGSGIPANSASFAFPSDVAFGPDGAPWIGDTDHHLLRRIGPDGIVTNVAGGGSPASGNGDGGLATEALVNIGIGNGDNFTGMANDALGNVYFCEPKTGLIRCVSVDGFINTVAGDGAPSFSGDGGPATAAGIYPVAVTVAADGTIFFADASHRIRRISTPLPGFSGTDFAIPSEDGSQIFRFDATGRHLSTVNAYTRATLYTFRYNGSGQLTAVIDGDNNQTQIRRTAGGAPTAIVGPYGATTALGTDGRGRLSSVTNPLGKTTTLVNDENGLLQSETDPLGNVTAFTYEADNLGRLQLSTLPDASLGLTRQDFDDGFSIRTTSALGVTRDFGVTLPDSGAEFRTIGDILGQRSSLTVRTDGTLSYTQRDGDSSEMAFGPDPRFGQTAQLETLRTAQLPSGATRTIQRSESFTLASGTDPLAATTLTGTVTLNGKSAQRVFTAATRTFETTSPLGRKETLTVDPQGRFLKSEVAGLATLAVTYDPRGNFTSILTGTGATQRATRLTPVNGYTASQTDALGQIEKYQRNTLGLVTSRTRPDGSIALFGYDDAGHLSSITPAGRSAHLFAHSPNGDFKSYTAPALAGQPATVMTYTYDADRRLSRIDFPGGESNVFAYDTAGRLQTRTDSGQATTYTYDPVTGLATTVTAANGDAIAITSDGSYLTGFAWSGNVVGSVSHTLNDLLFAATQTVSGGQTINFVYDDDGDLTSAGALSFTRETHGWVNTSTLAQINDQRTFNEFGEQTGYVAQFGSTPLLSIEATYDKGGRITHSVEVSGGSTDTFDYTYDSLDRLRTVAKNGSPAESFSYDAAGSRLTAGPVTATYDAQDRLLQAGPAAFTYTPRGNRLTRTDGTGTTTYTHNARGSLTLVAPPGQPVIGYLYDPLLRRIGREVGGVVANGYLYDRAGRIVAELDGQSHLVSQFIYADRRFTPAYMIKGGQTYRFLVDLRGSIRAVVDANSGVVAQQLTYSAYGQVLTDSAPGFQPFGFAGGLYDAATGLLRFGVRDYDPTTGTWLEKDPQLFDGHQFNLYAYAADDPINRIDSRGTDTVSVGTLGGNTGHTSISVDGDPFVGFYPAGNDQFFTNDIGNLRPEGDQYNPISITRFEITKQQAERIRKFIQEQKGTRRYHVIQSNCTDFVIEALQKGDVIPKSILEQLIPNLRVPRFGINVPIFLDEELRDYARQGLATQLK